jgi:hypothetical protein
MALPLLASVCLVLDMLRGVVVGEPQVNAGECGGLT